MSLLGGTALAAVFTPKRDPSTWSGFFGFLALAIGCAITLIGLYAAISHSISSSMSTRTPPETASHPQRAVRSRPTPTVRTHR